MIVPTPGGEIDPQHIPGHPFKYLELFRRTCKVLLFHHLKPWRHHAETEEGGLRL